MHINILIYGVLYCIARIFAGAKFRRIAYYCFQGYIQDFCSGGGGWNLTDDLLCTCVYLALLCIY